MKKIKLSKGKVALVDDADYERVSALNWFSITKPHTTYAVRGIYDKGYRGMMRMHRFIMNPPRGKVIDHLNGNGLDNRRSNLRVCGESENQRNRKVHRKGHLLGTSKSKASKKNPWMAQIRVDGTGKQHYLGLFPTQKLAHDAVLLAIKNNHVS